MLFTPLVDPLSFYINLDICLWMDLPSPANDYQIHFYAYTPHQEITTN